MRLIVRGSPYPYQHPTYRGTDREGPSYVDGFASDHPANVAYAVFLSASREELTYLDAVEPARRIVAGYARMDPPERFEILEVTRHGEVACLEGVRLGYDISFAYHHSLISDAIAPTGTPSAHPPPTDSYWQVVPLLMDARATFQPLLNEHGLFDDPDTAQRCLDRLVDIQTLRPFMWFARTLDGFEVIGVWLVS